jgi:hypothetical protein
MATGTISKSFRKYLDIKEVHKIAIFVTAHMQQKALV